MVAVPNFPFSVRPMETGDINQINALERSAFPTLWPPTSYARELRNKNAEYVVCESDTDTLLASFPPPKGLWKLLGRRNKPAPPERVPLIAGYLGVWHMGGNTHIVSIASHEDYRRQGVGQLLLIASVEIAQLRNQEAVTLEVRVSNEPAKELYRKYGFEEVGLRKRYYLDNNEDATIMSTPAIKSILFSNLFADRCDEFNARYGQARREYLE